MVGSYSMEIRGKIKTIHKIGLKKFSFLELLLKRDDIVENLAEKPMLMHHSRAES